MGMGYSIILVTQNNRRRMRYSNILDTQNIRERQVAVRKREWTHWCVSSEALSNVCSKRRQITPCWIGRFVLFGPAGNRTCPFLDNTLHCPLPSSLTTSPRSFTGCLVDDLKAITINNYELWVSRVSFMILHRVHPSNDKSRTIARYKHDRLLPCDLQVYLPCSFPQFSVFIRCLQGFVVPPPQLPSSFQSTSSF